MSKTKPKNGYHTGEEGRALLASVDWGELAPEEMSVLTLPSADWLDAANRAARYEREQDYGMARTLWAEAAACSLLSLDRRWCEARAQWCARQEAQDVPDMF
ncbi:ANR family transcriptional regulator [Raoultella ornithinolytica]|uniref:ANR family transcriptional regulator n=1 Tax=Raoultella ornithinolytica TaxID=54291 RepID=UPI0021AFB191|nr:ANR family transcriptional regulator [Raoultella ornithinolytica]MCT4737226.1 ANR family transcriptional regulator [Raoultella ornithinolytica]